MGKLNYIELETSKGYKSISVLHGDILKITDQVDIMIVSIFKGGLTPIPGTLLGDLSNSGIDSVKLHKDMAFNFCKGLNTWLSQTIEGHPFKRILFFEMRSFLGNTLEKEGIEVVFENLFLTLMILEKKGIPIKKVAMPLLGTGNQNLDMAKVISLLLSLTERFLNELDTLQSISFVEKDNKKARSMSQEIDKALGRLEIRLNSVSYGKNVRKSIVDKLVKIQQKGFPDGHILNELEIAIKDNDSRYYQIGILGRRTLEFVLHDIVPGNDQTLYDKLNKLKDEGIADWTLSYMHLIRVFGNTSAHHKAEASVLKSSFNEEDLLLNLISIEKVLGFWIENREVLLKKVSVFDKNKLGVYSVV